jgi:hypothetical protein
MVGRLEDFTTSPSYDTPWTWAIKLVSDALIICNIHSAVAAEIVPYS